VAAEQQGNGRVTMAVLSTKLDYLIQKVEGIDNAVCGIDERVDAVERRLDRHDERWSAHKEEHGRERGLLAVASIVQSAVAGIVGVFVKP
jgi:hypothetical protein